MPRVSRTETPGNMRYIESFKIFAPEFRKWNTRMPYIIENTLNPIRHILEQIPIKPHPDLPMIPLSIGDPSVFGNFPAPKEASQDRIFNSCPGVGL